MKFLLTLGVLAAPLFLASLAPAQILEDFESGNPDDWGWDYEDPTHGIVSHDGTLSPSGGNPGAYLEFIVLYASGLPVNFLWARTQPASWTGDFRERHVSAARFDYRHNDGFLNLYFPFQLALGDDRGTPGDLTDDVMAIVFTGSALTAADQTWHTASAPIPASSSVLPAEWSIWTMPQGTNPYPDDDAAWNAIVRDVDYLAFTTAYPDSPLFGIVFLDIDNIALELGSPATAFCFCDGSGLLAPCGNLGVPGRGCDNSASSGGAVLGSAGTASVAASSLVFDTAGGTPNAFGVFFQGTLQGGGGAGTVFNDGFLCADGSIQRLEVVQLDAAGSATSSVNVAVEGQLPPTGGTRTYQFWYRDPVGSPCGTLSNTSNGLEIVWIP